MLQLVVLVHVACVPQVNFHLVMLLLAQIVLLEGFNRAAGKVYVIQFLLEVTRFLDKQMQQRAKLVSTPVQPG